MNILLFIHAVISVLLITAILLQKTGANSLSGLSSGGGEGGAMIMRSANVFLSRVIVILAIMFFANALVLANLSSNSSKTIIDKLQQPQHNSIPIAN